MASTLFELREDFWSKIPNGRQRREKIYKALVTARKEFNNRLCNNEIRASDFPDRLCYVLDGRYVCEKAYVNMLGCANAKGEKPKMWDEVKKSFAGVWHYPSLHDDD